MDKKDLTIFSLSLYGDVKAYDRVRSLVRCRIFYKYENRNGTYITDEFAEKLISTLPYTPVKGIYDSMEEDYTDHGKQRYEGRIYGVVPVDNHFAWEKHLDEDGVEREYACTDVLLYTGIYKKEAFDIVDCAQSMELYADSIEGEWKFINGKKFFVFTDGCFLGLQALGEDYEPCFEGAAFYSLIEEINQKLDKFELYLSQFNQQEEGGESYMDFKLSDNQKYNMIWTLLNSRFNEENGYIMDYAVCEVYEQYAIAFNYESGNYERVYYTKDDETDSLEINSKEICYIVDVNEEEKRALAALQAIHENTYEKIDTDYSELLEKNETYSQKIEENEVEISTLKQEKESTQAELDEVNQNYSTALELIDDLTKENESLNTFKEAVILQEKENVINQYVTMLTPEVIDSFKEKINNLTKEELEKELAYTLVKSSPTLFNKKEEEPDYAPKDDIPLEGIEGILSRYKK